MDWGYYGQPFVGNRRDTRRIIGTRELFIAWFNQSAIDGYIYDNDWENNTKNKNIPKMDCLVGNNNWDY